ncbi:phosphoglucosamine mutase [Halopenitus sp. H-Gu1]|uniref:phosphoglucosamine mutase n=1 Tax=Halopenitus sp. H-Gu1 TaxID=3242697 RepID=UPI00359E21FC
MKIFGSSGVRGVAIDDLSPEFVLRIAKAAGTVWEADRVAIARDTRTTGEVFRDAAAAGLATVGCDVDHLGVVPTPAVGHHCAEYGTPCVLVTASHNPPEFNGIKLIGSDGVELSVDALSTIEDHVLDESFAETDWRGAGSSRRIDGVADAYVESVVDAVDRPAIADADLTVAVDPGHGAGSITNPEVFRRLGCAVRTVNAQPDGHFPGRLPEPIPEHLADLSRLVRTTDADLGIAHDGDADRAVFVDETGTYIEGDASLAALAADALSTGDVAVSAVNVSKRLVDVCADVGADLELTPIGATNIITRVRELEAAGRRVPIAGEGNGGVFFPDYRLSRDGAYIAARFLELLVDGAAASEVVEPYAAYHNVRSAIPYDSETERDRLLAAAEEYAGEVDAELDTTDGYRLDYDDGWVLVRPSGTEPKIRVYAEARSSARANELADDVLDALADAR